MVLLLIFFFPQLAVWLTGHFNPGVRNSGVLLYIYILSTPEKFFVAMHVLLSDFHIIVDE